jgi:hypothetical protein
MSYFEFGTQAFCEPFLVHGWSRPENGLVWSEGPRSSLFLPIDVPGHALIQLQLFAFLAGGHACSFYLFANGVFLGRFELKGREQEFNLEFNNKLFSSTLGLNLDFFHVEPDSPAVYGLGADERSLNLAIRSVRITSLGESLSQIQPQDFGINRFTSVVRRRFSRELVRRDELRNKMHDERSEHRLARLIQFYMYGYGGNRHQRRSTINKIVSLVAERDGDIAPLASKRLSRSPVERYSPSFSPFVFVDRNYDEVKTSVVLPEMANVNFDAKFSDFGGGKIANCFGVRSLEAEKIFKCDSADLVVNERQYIIIDRTGAACFAGCNPADLTRLSISSNIKTWDGGIVLLQDEYDCSNIAHFVFDSAVRLYHWCKTNPDLVRRTLFVLGGVPTEFHELVLKAVSNLFGFDGSQFLFPQETVRLRPVGGLYWFASQCKSQHPANSMRSESLTALEEIAREVTRNISLNAARSDKIYVSRSDALLRRLANEEELCSYLKGLGFEIVVMSNHPSSDQIAIMSRAKVIIGPHGMGFTHLVFNNKRPKVVELFNPEVGSGAYALLCRARGDDYHRVIGRQVDNNRRDFVVDISEVQALLQ